MHPVLLELPFGLRLYSFGILLGLAYAVGFYLFRAAIERDGLDRSRFIGAFAWSAVSSLVGARLIGLAVSPPTGGSLLDYVQLDRGGGIVAYGGFLGGFVGLYGYCRWRGLNLGAWLDAAAPTIGSALCLARVGCFLAGCDFGTPSASPFAVSFPAGSPAWQEHIAQGLLSRTAATSLPVHPTQLYEAIGGLLLFGLVLLVRRRGRRDGEALATFTIGYGILRFATETIRGDIGRGQLGPWSTSQWIALLTSAAAVAYLAARARRLRAASLRA